MTNSASSVVRWVGRWGGAPIGAPSVEALDSNAPGVFRTSFCGIEDAFGGVAQHMRGVKGALDPDTLHLEMAGHLEQVRDRLRSVSRVPRVRGVQGIAIDRVARLRFLLRRVEGANLKLDRALTSGRNVEASVTRLEKEWLALAHFCRRAEVLSETALKMASAGDTIKLFFSPQVWRTLQTVTPTLGLAVAVASAAVYLS